jgi:hypothetical protein
MVQSFSVVSNRETAQTWSPCSVYALSGGCEVNFSGSLVLTVHAIGLEAGYPSCVSQIVTCSETRGVFTCLRECRRRCAVYVIRQCGVAHSRGVEVNPKAVSIDI